MEKVQGKELVVWPMPQAHEAGTEPKGHAQQIFALDLVSRAMSQSAKGDKRDMVHHLHTAQQKEARGTWCTIYILCSKSRQEGHGASFTLSMAKGGKARGEPPT
eukprot:831491-Pelagomonas_calceolata.AAC.1